MAFIFVGGHTGYISGKDMLYQLLLFVIVYCFMARTYEAFETQTKKSMELIYSQGLALFLADAVTYLTGYVTKTSINDIWMMLLKLVAQTAYIHWEAARLCAICMERKRQLFSMETVKCLRK